MEQLELLSADDVRKMDAYWRAANYLSVGQIYLHDNPLLTEPLTLDHIKARLLGHFGTTPGLNFIYVHCNRVIKKYDLNTIYICGPLKRSWHRREKFLKRWACLSKRLNAMQRMRRRSVWPQFAICD